jgi:nitrite reductase/ring-hydroxylating ferredoxin subunit
MRGRPLRAETSLGVPDWWIDAGAASEYAEATMRLVCAGRHQIGVVKWRSNFYATLNRCPHARGPLCLGRVAPRVAAGERGPGSLTVDFDHPTISCPWHGWDFDLATGRSLGDGRLKVRTYPVHLRGGRVYVEASRPSGERA